MARLRTFLILLLIGVGVALSLSSGCMTDPVTGRRSLGLVNPTDDEEVLQGRQYAPSFVAEYDGVYPDAEAADHLAGIVRRIGALSHRPRLPYRFTLLNSSVPNAFALPGGEVFMTRGLLARLGEEAQFAVVMAHEIGHVNHRHSVKAMNDALVVGLGTSVLAGTLRDEKDREVAAGLASAGGGLLLLRFSRDQELEADDRGAEYAYAAGYDPAGGRGSSRSSPACGAPPEGAAGSSTPGSPPTPSTGIASATSMRRWAAAGRRCGGTRRRRASP